VLERRVKSMVQSITEAPPEEIATELNFLTGITSSRRPPGSARTWVRAF